MSCGHQECGPKATKAQSRPRLQEIDRAKAVAIIFVVVGHVSDPGAPAWADYLRALIYNFHMPVFMFLSGYVFVYASAHVVKTTFWRYVVRRADRLLVPFLVMAVVTISLKLIGGRYTELNREPVDIIQAYTLIFLNTQNSPALDLWYLFVLFAFSVVTPVLLRMVGGRFWPLLLLSIGMFAVFADPSLNGITSDFYVSRMCWFYLFFICGCMACRYAELWNALVDRTWPIALGLFAVADLATLTYAGVFGTAWRFPIVALLATVGIIGLMRSKWLRHDRVLLWLAESTLTIYLLNSIVVAAVKAVFVKFADPANTMIWLYVMAVGLGLFVPIGIRKCLTKLAITRPVLRYVS